MKKAIFIMQIVCILCTGFGIYIEYTFKADLGFLLITVGSLIFAVTTKLTKVSMRREIKELLNKRLN